MANFRKLACGLMALTFIGSAFAGCGQTSGNGGDSTKTKIMVMNTGGGIGRVWLDEAIKRFSDLKKNEPYEDGKTGVEFEVEHNMATGVGTMQTAGYNVYFDGASPMAKALAADGRVLNINDIVTEQDSTGSSIESRIDASYRGQLKGQDGEYYVLPHYAHGVQVSYDISRFTADDLYFAAPDADKDSVEEFNSKYGSAKFAMTSIDPDVKKSCGNDGEYGTYDDGLPTSLVEFIILCARMQKVGIQPMNLSGKSMGYNYMFVEALWASLGGYEETMAKYNYTGTVKIVDGEPTSDNLFEGIDYIKKVNTKSVEIDLGTGYLANDSVARYYAIAMLEIMENEGWFSDYSYEGNNTHTDAMWNFISNGRNGVEKLGMFIEGDYWYNEARDNDKIKNFNKLCPGEDINIGMMPLPTSVYESVVPGKGRELCNLADSGRAYAFINANISDKLGLVRACKEFLQFCYSQEELDYFTAYTGVARSGIKVNNIQQGDVPTDMYLGGSNYAKSKIALWTASNVKNVWAMQTEYYNGDLNIPVIEGVKYGSPLKAIRDAESTAWTVFDVTRTRKSGWGVTNL